MTERVFAGEVWRGLPGDELPPEVGFKILRLLHAGFEVEVERGMIEVFVNAYGYVEEGE